MALAAPRICCLDRDTFFVSVERVLDPQLVGKPVMKFETALRQRFAEVQGRIRRKAEEQGILWRRAEGVSRGQ